MTHGRAQRFALFLSVLVMELALVLAFIPPSAAHAQIANAVYEGSHSGGGTIKVFVGADGQSVPKLEIYEIPGDICTWQYFFLTATANAPRIVNGEFSGTSENGTGANGRFTARDRVEGSFKVSGTTDSGRLCTSPVYNYTATTGAAPGNQPPSPPPGNQPPQPPRPGTPPTPPPASPAGASGNFCRPGETLKFQFGLLDLKQQLGDVMGEPLECEHPNSANGDTLQRTTKGLAYYRKATNTPTFTNGDEHWALTPRGLLYWTGPSVDPP